MNNRYTNLLSLKEALPSKFLLHDYNPVPSRPKKIDYHALDIEFTKRAVPCATPKFQKILNYQIHMDSHHETVSPSREHIAKVVGCDVKTVDRANEWMESQRLIKISKKKKSARMNFTNQYVLNKVFRDPTLRYWLSKVYRALSSFALILLFTGSSKGRISSGQFQNVAPLINDLEYNSNNTIVRGSYDPGMYKNYTGKRGCEMFRAETESPLTREKQERVNYLHPSVRARIEIEKYSIEAIKYANSKLRRQIRNGFVPKSPLLVLFKFCEEYSTKHGLLPDRDYTAELIARYSPDDVLTTKVLDCKTMFAEAEASRKPRKFKEGSSLKEEKPSIPSTKKMKQDMSSAPAWKNPKIDADKEAHGALSRLKNDDGSFKNAFARFLE